MTARITVGVPKETKTDEYRVAMLPVGVEELTRLGHRVLVQTGAGQGSGIADEQYAATARHHVANRGHGAVQHGDALLKVDDVNAVAHAENIRLHLRIPTTGVVTEVNAGFQKLAHGE